MLKKNYPQKRLAPEVGGGGGGVLRCFGHKHGINFS